MGSSPIGCTFNLIPLIMTAIFIIVLILIVLFLHTNPYIDVIRDHSSKKHYLIWYTNFKSERVYIDITGS